MSEILSGIAVKERFIADLKKQCAILKEGGVTPCLALLRVGEQRDDLAYESGIRRLMDQVGVAVTGNAFPAAAAYEEVAAVIAAANRDHTVSAILPLLPLPPALKEIVALIDPKKDVDGLRGDESCFFPCTPRAVMKMLDFYDISVTAKKVVVLGRSPLVGLPLRRLLEERGALVSVVHSKTEDPAALVRTGELVFSAVGIPRLLDEDYLRPGQTIFDVGISPDPSKAYGICGDLDEDVAERLNLRYTPVPGGVGEVTTAVLAGHVLAAAAKRED